MEYKLEKKLEFIENELKILKNLIISNTNFPIKNPVSFRGMARTNLSGTKLDKAIGKAKKSISKVM